jgi:perosamine synthetase
MKVKQSWPTIDMEEYIAIKECFDVGWFTEGEKSKKFEDKIKKMLGVKYGILTPSGTTALYVGLKSIGIGIGDEVIVPDYTFHASAAVVIMAEAKPIFVDVEKENFQIDIDICEKIVKQRKIKAIMPVHMHGICCNMDRVMDFAKKHNILVIEDACQAIGTNWKGKMAGSFGDVGCLSFFADKCLTTVEGGFVATDNKKIYNKLQYLKNHGRLVKSTFVHPELGYNFCLNDILASIGLVQLKKFDSMVKRRIYLNNLYKECLKDVNQVKILEPIEGSNHVPFKTVLLCESESQDLMNYLVVNDIESRTMFYPMHKQPCFQYLKDVQDLSDDKFENAIYAFKHGINLPCYPDLSDEQVIYVAKIIKEYYNL